MKTIQNIFLHSLIRFILDHNGNMDDCRVIGDYITEASRIADEKKIEPPCLNFQRFYSDEIYKLQRKTIN